MLTSLNLIHPIEICCGVPGKGILLLKGVILLIESLAMNKVVFWITLVQNIYIYIYIYIYARASMNARVFVHRLKSRNCRKPLLHPKRAFLKAGLYG